MLFQWNKNLFRPVRSEDDVGVNSESDKKSSDVFGTNRQVLISTKRPGMYNCDPRRRYFFLASVLETTIHF